MVAYYHPQCPHCHGLVGDYSKFAQETSEENIGLKVYSVNMSTSDREQALAINIPGFPTVRLYTAKNEFKDFGPRDIRELSSWLQQ